MSRQSHSLAWKEFAGRWEKCYHPPGRPSDSALEVYRIGQNFPLWLCKSRK